MTMARSIETIVDGMVATAAGTVMLEADFTTALTTAAGTSTASAVVNAPLSSRTPWRSSRSASIFRPRCSRVPTACLLIFSSTAISSSVIPPK